MTNRTVQTDSMAGQQHDKKKLH